MSSERAGISVPNYYNYFRQFYSKHYRIAYGITFLLYNQVLGFIFPYLTFIVTVITIDSYCRQQTHGKCNNFLKIG